MTDRRIASCDCGATRLDVAGDPITTAVCYCDDCQAAARQLEQMGAPPGFHDRWGGTAYATYRDDRLVWLQGENRLREAKLRPDAPTTRFLAGCCNSPMCLKFRAGWWTSVYLGRLGADAPACRMRVQTRFVEAGDPLPDDLPRRRGIAPGLVFELLSARLAMAFGRRS